MEAEPSERTLPTPPPPPLRPQGWPDLTPELLSQVLLRLPSLADRARCRAVCSRWRLAARQYPPPTLPWLVLHHSGTAFTLAGAGAAVHRFPALPGCGGTRCCGAADDMLVMVNADDSEFSLFSPFSKAVVQLPKLDDASCGELLLRQHKQNAVLTCKVVVCSAAGPVPGSIVALMVLGLVFFFHLGTASPPTKFRQPFDGVLDIAFYQGKLYSLNTGGALFAAEVTADGGELKVAHSKCIDSSCSRSGDAKGIYATGRYLVESRGRLLMVCRSAGIPLPRDEPRPYLLEVFEAELSASPCRWRRVESLDGEVLFLSKSCSKSLPACCCGVQGDCIYLARDSLAIGDRPFFKSCIYNMRDGTVNPFPPATTKKERDEWCQTWLFHPY